MKTETYSPSEIISKLFTSKWNYAWGVADEHIISLFYKKGGFVGLYDYIVLEKERLDKDKNFPFDNYYSKDIINILAEAKEKLNEQDFRNYIFTSGNVVFNSHNFEKLEQYGLLKYYYDFGGNFRGNIVEHHKIGKYSIIESYTKKGNETHFYNEGDFTTCFHTLEEALIYNIYKGQHYSALIALLNHSKTN